ncbi:hypothetical protein OSTOST_19199, partial [Ostertagia ostertagi]
RIRDGEVSSDDDLYEEDGEVVDEERSAEYEQQLIAHMQKLHIEVEPDRLANVVSEMVARVHIRSTQSSRERMPSPPRTATVDLSGDVPAVDLPWYAGGDGGKDEVLEENLSEENEKPGQCLYVYKWSETLFPDETATTVGEKRPLDVAEVI